VLGELLAGLGPRQARKGSLPPGKPGFKPDRLMDREAGPVLLARGVDVARHERDPLEMVGDATTRRPSSPHRPAAAMYLGRASCSLRWS
jgi:hypothetical protein